MVAWLSAVAAVIGPVSIIVGAPGAVIGSIVAVVKVRRWAVHTFAPQQAATQAALDRATSSVEEQAAASAAHLRESKNSNAEVVRALVFMADELGKTRDELQATQEARDREAARNDEVFAALVLAKTPTRPPEPPTQPEATAGEDDDAATVTGRHRLHSPETLRLQTIDEGDPT